MTSDRESRVQRFFVISRARAVVNKHLYNLKWPGARAVFIELPEAASYSLKSHPVIRITYASLQTSDASLGPVVVALNSRGSTHCLFLISR